MARLSRAQASQRTKKAWQTRRKRGKATKVALAGGTALGAGMAINARSLRRTGSRSVNPLFMAGIAAGLTSVRHGHRTPVNYSKRAHHS